MFLSRRVPGLVLLAVVMTTLPASAIVSDMAPDDLQPFVGLAVFGSGGSAVHACSGALIAPTVFVTAGHCTEGTDDVRVWFESEVTFSSSAAHAGVPMSRPDFSGVTSSSSNRDIGVVILEEPVDVPAYGVLPAVGSLDDFVDGAGSEQASLTIVGYGFYAVASFLQDEYFRYQATGLQLELRAAALDEYTLHVLDDRMRRQPGGLCIGDSGGPALISGTNVIAGLGSFIGTSDCTGVGAYARLDTDLAQEFIHSVLR